MKPLLKVENLRVSLSDSLREKIEIVRDVSFSLNAEETLGMIGESGCGKSTILKSIIGLIPQAKGKILYKGEDLLAKSKKALQSIRGKEIGMIFQNPSTSFDPTVKVGKQIVESYLWHYPKSPKRAAHQLGIDLLKLMKISQPELCFKKYPHELSGGMRQRMAIAIAVISSPNLLIADEPMTNLDIITQIRTLNLLRTMQRKTRASMIFVSHNLNTVVAFCDTILVIYAGQIVESGPAAQFHLSAKHPYTRLLLHSIPRMDLPPTRPLKTIEGSPPNPKEKIVGCSFAPRCAYAKTICRTHFPPPTQITDEHKVHCWLYERTR